MNNIPEEEIVKNERGLSFPERHPYIPMVIAIIALIVSYMK